MNKLLLNGFKWSLIDRLINQLGYFLITLYLARLIGPESFGLIGMLSVFIILSESVLSGFSQALIQKSHKLTEEDSSTIFYVNLIWASGIYGVLYLSAPAIASFYQQAELINISRILFLSIFINSLMVVFRAKLTINIDFKSQAIAASFATFIGASVAIFMAKNHYGYWALVMMTLSRGGTLLIGLFFYSRWVPRWIFSKKSFQNLFGFGSYLMFANIVATIVNNLSIVLIGRFFNAAYVGYFYQALNISNQASTLLASTLQNVTYPVMTSIQDDLESLIILYKKLISIAMLISLPALVGLAVVSHEFVLLLLGENWKPVVPVLVALCFAKTITPISAINLNILNAIGRSDLFLKVDLFKLPISLLGIFIAIPFGINILSWMMVATSLIAFFFNTYYPSKLFGFGAWEQIKVAKNYIVASSIMYITLSLLKFENLLASLLVKALCGIVIYIVILFIMRDVLFLSLLRRLMSVMNKEKSNEQ